MISASQLEKLLKKLKRGREAIYRVMRQLKIGKLKIKVYFQLQCEYGKLKNNIK